MSHDNKRDGFTLIELMLSMTFISILLIMVAMMTIRVSQIYNKGLTLREVNQVGRVVSGDLQRSIASSVPFDVTPQDRENPIPTSRYVEVPGQGGRLCIGRYTYAWNYGVGLKNNDTYNKYTGAEVNTPIHFVKVDNPSASLCTDPNSNIDKSAATEMMASGDRDLAVHKVDIAESARDDSTGQALYAITMTIGTNDQAELTDYSDSCKPPSESAGNESYCSVNQFDIVVRAGNSTGGDQQ